MFKNLRIGQRFQFPRSPIGYGGFDGGIAVKISPRRYRYERTGMVCTVGTVSVKVEKVTKKG